MKWAKLLDVPYKVLKILVGLNMLLALLLLFVNVVLRTGGFATLEWVEPLVVYLIMWMVFLGTGLVFAGDEHLSMGILYDRASKPVQRLLDVFNNILVIAVSIFLVYYGSIVTRNLHMLGQKSMDGHIPLYLVMLSIPVGAAVTIITVLVALLRPKRQRPEPPKEE